MQPEVLTYDADGLSMHSLLFLPDASKQQRPGVLLFPEAPGLGKHVQQRAERLAGLGYVALACDLHGQGKVIEDMDRVMATIGPLRQNPEHLRARAQGGLTALQARPEVDPGRIAAIGYCIGGTMALELARSGGGIAGVVSFHGGLSTAAPQDARAIKGKVLICTGGDDPGINADQRRAFEDEMNAGGVDWQMNIYGGVVHSFTNPDAAAMNRPDFVRYDAKADARSWIEMRAFFDEIFATV